MLYLTYPPRLLAFELMRILGGFFLLYWSIMEQYSKPPLSCNKQIDLLTNRDLVASDHAKAERFSNIHLTYYLTYAILAV